MKVQSGIRPEYIQSIQGVQLVSFDVKELTRLDNGAEVNYFEYEQIRVDPTFDVDAIDKLVAKAKSNEAQKYLASTDWYLVRFIDSGVEVPQEVKDKRAEARLLV